VALLRLPLRVMLQLAADRPASSFSFDCCSGKTSWTFPHDIAHWDGLGAKITPQALREMDGA